MQRSSFTGVLKGRDFTVHAKDGVVHREDGPAIEAHGEIRWFLHGVEQTPERYWFRAQFTKYAPQIFSQMSTQRNTQRSNRKGRVAQANA